MKLENFDRVRELIKDRDYVKSLRQRIASGHNARLAIGDNRTNDLHVKPEIVAKLAPEMVLILDQQIAIVDEELAKLGVITEQAAA